MRVNILAKAVTNKQEQSTNGKSGFKSLIPLFTLIAFKLTVKRLHVAIFEMLERHDLSLARRALLPKSALIRLKLPTHPRNKAITIIYIQQVHTGIRVLA